MIDLKNIYIHGRTVYIDNVLHLFNTASGIEFNANASFISLVMKTIPNQQRQAWMKVIIDNDYDNPLDLIVEDSKKEYIVLSTNNQKLHNIKILKASEAIESYVEIYSLNVSGLVVKAPEYRKTFLVYGDSTVSAYGNLGHLGEEKKLLDTDGLNGYCFLTAKAFNATMNSVNGSGWGLVFSPWTTPKRRPLLSLYDKVAPLSSLPYDVKNLNPTVVIISLGTNDSYYIIEGEDGKSKNELILEFKESYHKLLKRIKEDFNDVPIIMVYGVMKERHNYEVMHEVFLENKDKFNLYEALLEGDGLGISAHPSAMSHKDISNKLIDLLKVIISE